MAPSQCLLDAGAGAGDKLDGVRDKPSNKLFAFGWVECHNHYANIRLTLESRLRD